MKTKQCSKCGEVYPHTRRYFASGGHGKLAKHCRVCQRNILQEYRYRTGMHRTLVPPRFEDVHSPAAPDKKAKHANLEARKRGLPATLTAEDWQHALGYFDNRCAICGNQDLFLAMDHWIPFNDPNCPGTTSKNILPLCHGVNGCNNNKAYMNPEKWLMAFLGKSKGQQKLVEIQAYFDSVE